MSGASLQRIVRVALGMLLLLLAARVCAEDRMSLIKKRGTIVVGVKTDYPPFGMLEHNGEADGFEHDLAINIAARLGVHLRKVGVTGANRLMQLNDGRVDLVIATIGDTAERRDIATLIEPNYYSSGVTLMTPGDSKLENWSELRGQTVCATQGSYFNRTLAMRYMLDLQLYNNGRDAKLAVRDRRCVGWAFDSTAIAGDLLSEEWKSYKTPLPPQWVTPWSIAVAHSEKGGELERVLGDIVADWHRNGFLIVLEKKWHLPPSDFLKKQHALWTATDATGVAVCHRVQDGGWPVPCRNPIFVKSTEVGGLLQFGLYIKEKAGVDLTFIYDDYERHQFLQGMATTLGLTVACVIGSILTGLMLAILADANVPALSPIVRLISLFSRMTPPLLQMYVLLFGVGSMLYAQWGIKLDPFAVAVVCLSCYTGSTMMHILLIAAQAKRQADNAFFLRLATLPQLLRICATPISAALINVSKATMLASAIAVPDLLSVSTAIIAEHGNAGAVMNAVMLLYVLMIYILTSAFRKATGLIGRI